MLVTAIQLVIYLVSQNADIEYAYPRKRRKYISDSPSEIQQHEVGVRIGATIRKTRKVYLSEGTPIRAAAVRDRTPVEDTGTIFGLERRCQRANPQVGRSNVYTWHEVVVYPLKPYYTQKSSIHI